MAMTAFLLALIASPVSLPTPAELTELLLKDAETAAKMREPSSRVMIYTGAADIWRHRDPKKARKLIEQAWEQSLQIPENRGNCQTDVVRAMAAIDYPEAKRLAKSIKDSYWNEFGNRYLASSRAEAHPSEAGQLLKADDQETYQSACDLFRENADDAIVFVSQFRPEKREELLGYLAYNFVEEDYNKGFRAYELIVGDKKRQETAVGIIKGIANWSPERALSLLPTIQRPLERIEALAYSADALRFSDPDASRRFGVEAVALIDKLPPASDDLETVRRTSFLPLARAQAPGIERLQREWDKKAEIYDLMERVGIWANLDMKMAEKILARSPTSASSPGLRSGCFGVSAQGGYLEYVARLGLVDPKKAGALLREAVKGTLGGGGSADYEGISHFQVLERILRDPADKVRAFIRASGYASLSRAYEQQLLGRKCLADPKNAKATLLKMEKDDELWDWDRSRTSLRTAKKLLPDLDAAVDVLSVNPDQLVRASCLAELAAFAYPKKNEEATALLLKARAMTVDSLKNYRADYLLDYARMTHKLDRQGWKSL